MAECSRCGFVGDEDFIECPSCGEKQETEPEEEVSVETGTEDPKEADDIGKDKESTVPPAVNKLAEYRSCGIPDNVDYSEGTDPNSRHNRKIPTNAIVICAVVLIIAFAVVLIIGKGGFSDKTLETTETVSQVGSTEQTKPEKNDDITVVETKYSMSGVFADYQISINGMVYQVHMTVGEILDSGWTFTEGVVGGTLPAGDKTELLLSSVDGAVMQITAVNFSSDSRDCRECIVSEIKVERSRNPQAEITIIGGLQMGMADISSLETMIGKCPNKVSASRGTVLTYTESENQIAQFTFQKETGELIGIRYTNSGKPKNYNDEPFSEGNEIPDPTDPVVTPTAGIISIDGDNYRLPIEVSDLMAKGWSGKFESIDSRLPSGGRAYATFTRGDAVLSGIDVYNPGIRDEYVDNCCIVSVSSASAEGWVVFPMGIKVGISEEALLLSIEGLDYAFDDTYFAEYSFEEGDYTFVVDVDKKTKKVIYISSSYIYK